MLKISFNLAFYRHPTPTYMVNLSFFFFFFFSNLSLLPTFFLTLLPQWNRGQTQKYTHEKKLFLPVLKTKKQCYVSL